jgi:hypothetical protein
LNYKAASTGYGKDIACALGSWLGRFGGHNHDEGEVVSQQGFSQKKKKEKGASKKSFDICLIDGLILGFCYPFGGSSLRRDAPGVVNSAERAYWFGIVCFFL